MKYCKKIVLCLLVVLLAAGCNNKGVTYVEKSFNNIKFQVPDDWIDSSDEKSAMFVNKKSGADITLSVASTSSGTMNLKDFTTIATRSYSPAFMTYSETGVKSEDKKNMSDVNIDEPEYLSANGNDVSRTTITYDYKADDDTYKFTEIVCCTIMNDTIYQFNYKVHTDKYDDFKDIIDNSINSIKN